MTAQVIASTGGSGGTITVSELDGVSKGSQNAPWLSAAYSALFVIRGHLEFLDGTNTSVLDSGDFALVSQDAIRNLRILDPVDELLAITCVESGESRTNSLNGQPLKASQASSGSSNIDLESETNRPSSLESFIVRANEGSRWAFAGLASRSLVKPDQCNGRFSACTLDWSSSYPERPFFGRYICFTTVWHYIYVLEGTFMVKFKEDEEWIVAEAGQSITIPARRFATLDFKSEYANLNIYSDGLGIDELIRKAGNQCEQGVPRRAHKWDGWDEVRLKSACAEIGAQVE